MSTQINDNFKLVAPKALDARYLDGSSLPYVSVTAANTAIAPSYRHRGLTVNVNGVEYWYKDGVADSNLVQKVTPATLDNVVTNGNVTDNAMVVASVTAAGPMSLLDTLQMSNANWAQWRNAADTAWLNVLTLDGSNRVNIGNSLSGTATSLRFFSSGSVNPNMSLSTSGRLNLGNGTADCFLNASQGTDAIGLPVGTTAQRPATIRPGFFRYNSTTQKPEYSTTTTWVPLIDTLSGVLQNVIASSYASLRGATTATAGYIYYVADARKQGPFFYDPTDNSSADNGGTVLVSTNGLRFKRIYAHYIDPDWFGCIPDYALSGSSTMTGTNNTPFLDAALNAAGENEEVIMGFGNYRFTAALNTWTSTRTRNLTVLGNTFHDAVGFIRMDPGGLKNHRFVHKGRAICREGLPDNSRANYLANTDPDWASFTGNFVTIADSNQKNIEMNYVSGFRAAIRLEAASGMQENIVRFQHLFSNAIGIELLSTDGTSYNDKNQFFGGRISGGTAIIIDGYQPYVGGSGNDPYNGAFRGNKFYGILFEALEKGIIMNGECTETSFVNCYFEGGLNTSIWSATKIFMRTSVADANPLANSDNYCRNTSWVNCGPMDLSWFSTAAGRRTQFIGCPIWVGGPSNANYVGYGAITDSNGDIFVRVHTIATSGIRGMLPANVYILPPDRPNKTQDLNVTGSVASGVRHVLCNNSSPIQVSLPAASNNYDAYVTIKRVGTATVTIFNGDTLRSDNILTTAGASVTYYSPPMKNRWDMVNKV